MSAYWRRCPICHCLKKMQPKQKTCSFACRKAKALQEPRKAKVSEGVFTCNFCERVSPAKRRNHRFCSGRCADNWNYRYGKKGQTAKRKRKEAMDARNERICKCALCGTYTEDLRPLKSLGGTERMAAGLYHRDHIQCRSHGGGDNMENARWLCWYCNLAGGTWWLTVTTQLLLQAANSGEKSKSYRLLLCRV